MATGSREGREDAGRTGAAIDVHPNQITQWRSQLLEGAAGVFGSEAKSEAAAPTIDVKTLHAKIGELALEKRFFVRRARQGWPSERKAMIDRAHDLPLNRQAKVLGISRGGVYYLPRAVPAADLALMRDRRAASGISLRGQPHVAGASWADGHKAGRLHVATLMKRMGSRRSVSNTDGPFW